MEPCVQISMQKIPAAVCTTAVPPGPSTLGTVTECVLARLCQVPPQPNPQNTFSFSHAEPLTLNFQPVNLPARFPNRWQVSHMTRISISRPILQNIRTLEQACSWPRNEITELRVAAGMNALTSQEHSSGLRTRMGTCLFTQGRGAP